MASLKQQLKSIEESIKKKAYNAMDREVKTAVQEIMIEEIEERVYEAFA